MIQHQNQSDAVAAGEPSPILAGPLLRRVECDLMVLWLVVREPMVVRFRLGPAGSNQGPLVDRELTDAECRLVRVGTHAYICLLEIRLEKPLPADCLLGYDLGLAASRGAPEHDWQWLGKTAQHLCHPGQPGPDFVFKSRIDRLYHGSCRRPHSRCEDGLVRIDRDLAKRNPDDRPALMIMTGDQIYADDVAGPMLHAIHCVIEALGLYPETLAGTQPGDSASLFNHRCCYYHRDQLLPETDYNEDLADRFFGGIRKPVFTTTSAGNHLITLAEVLAMYLLAWSPEPWRHVRGAARLDSPEDQQRYDSESERIERFRAGLPEVARVMAHVPTYMIFDDHDITDDWNLSALWEATAYEHPFSRRIIGNALIGYLLCQGWGNRPSVFGGLIHQARACLDGADETGSIPTEAQDTLITDLLAFEHWRFTLPTHPKVVVLDTRTQRWRSELRRSRPSGLLDWEGLTDFQHELMDQDAVIVVSPAPIFGVKLIEVIQRVFTWFGKPLLVDAENWMAHRGAASAMLNILGHARTPRHFVILSGDVHYSFAYDVRLRRGKRQPSIWQITSSGIKNEFPARLLDWLDRLNRWLYATRSPLNWFTKRRNMRIKPRLPSGRSRGERLWNRSGMGEVILDEHGRPTRIRQCNSDGSNTDFN